MKNISGIHDVPGPLQAVASPTLLLFDRNFLRDAGEVDDDQMLLELFQEYLAQLQHLQRVVAEVHNSPEKRPEFERLCHNLKSSSTEIGAFQLAHSLKELEQASRNTSDQFQILLSICSHVIDATLTEVEAEARRIKTRTI